MASELGEASVEPFDAQRGTQNNAINTKKGQNPTP